LVKILSFLSGLLPGGIPLPGPGEFGPEIKRKIGDHGRAQLFRILSLWPNLKKILKILILKILVLRQDRLVDLKGFRR